MAHESLNGAGMIPVWLQGYVGIHIISHASPRPAGSSLIKQMKRLCIRASNNGNNIDDCRRGAERRFLESVHLVGGTALG